MSLYFSVCFFVPNLPPGFLRDFLKGLSREHAEDVVEAGMVPLRVASETECAGKAGHPIPSDPNRPPSAMPFSLLFFFLSLFFFRTQCVMVAEMLLQSEKFLSWSQEVGGDETVLIPPPPSALSVNQHHKFETVARRQSKFGISTPASTDRKARV